MWKPWILAAIGTIMISDVAGRTFSSNSALVNSVSNRAENKNFGHSICQNEIERVCGRNVQNKSIPEVLFSKKSVQRVPSVGSQRQDLINEMRANIEKYSTPLPSNFNALCTNLNVNVAIDLQETNIEGIESIVKRWNLPEEVLSFLLTNTITEQVQTFRYQSYNYNVDQVRIDDTLVSFSNDGSNIALSYMKVSATGQQIQQYNTVRKCKRVLFKKKCHNENIPRDLTIDEQAAIQHGLLYHAQLNLKEEIEGLQAIVTQASQQKKRGGQEIESFFEDLDEYKVQEAPHVEQYLEMFTAGLEVADKVWSLAKSLFSTEQRETIVGKYTDVGLSALDTTTFIQMYKGVPEDKLDAIKDLINTGIEVPADKMDDLESWWTLMPIVEAQTWNFQNLAFTKDSNGNAKYLNLMYSQDQGTGKYMLLVADTKANFKVAEDMFIWEKYTAKFGGIVSKTETHIEYRPHSMTLAETQALLNVFDTIALGKFRTYLQTYIDSRKQVAAEDAWQALFD